MANALVHRRESLPAHLQALSDLAEERVWLANFTSPRTRTNYRQALADFVKVLGVNDSPALYAVQPAHVIAYRENLVGRGVSPRTVNARLAALSSLYKHLAERQLVAINPVSGVKRPKSGQRKVKAKLLSARQVRRLLDAPDRNTEQGLRDRALLHLYFYTGCRLAEAVNLKVGDFEPSRLDEPSLTMVVKGGKEHALFIADQLAEALEEYLSVAGHGHQKAMRLLQPVKKRPDQDGISSRQAGRIFASYAERAQLPSAVTPHSARATFITTALECGAPIENVQSSVSHSDISTTRLYDKRRFKPEDSASRLLGY